MNTLNLIDPEISAIKYETLVFPDGQPHIKIDTKTCDDLNKEDTLVVLSRISNTNDLLIVLLVKNTLDHLGFKKIELKISYLLAARMDRIMLPGEPFTLQVVANLINQAGFNRVSIFDPHSEVTTNIITNVNGINNHRFVNDVLNHYKNKYPNDDSSTFNLVSPDAGALKKIHQVAAATGGMAVVECKKKRDLTTGHLTGFTVFAENLDGRICFIIDDICDGGGTFIGIAKALKNLGAKKIILAVSHGIFSKGFPLENVDEIYCTDSYKTIIESIENVHVFNVLDYL
ncbi:MAG: ribose-phosphate diphosphokinase [Ferruginibacter sp.]